MLPLAVFSACAAVLLLPASAAPLPFETSDLQQPAGILAALPDQGLAADDPPAPGASTGAAPDRALRVPRGVGFREADYAVNAATAVQTVIPAESTMATPAAPAAAAATHAVLPRQYNVCEVTDCSKLPAGKAINDVNGAVDNQLPAGLQSSADAPGPEMRPYAVKAKANPVLSQSQPDHDAPTGASTAELPLAQVNAPLLTVSGTGDPALPKVPISGSDADAASSSSSQPSNIGTVIVERRGSYLRPTRYLSGSSLYPDEDPNPQPINPRAIEQLTVEGPAPRMNPKGDTSVMRLEAIPGLVF